MSTHDADSAMTAAAATRAVRKALDDAEIGAGDYEIHSHKTDSGADTVVTVSGWAPPVLRELIASALGNVEGSPKVRRTGAEFTLSFT